MIVYRIEYLLFISIGKLLSLFGLKYIKYTSKVLAFLFFYILRLRRKIVIRNLKIAFPHLKNKEITSIALNNYTSIAITFLELFVIPKLSNEEISFLFNVKDLEIIKRKEAEGNGVILLTAHYGNWEFAAIAIGLKLGIGINVLVKEQKNPFVTKWLKDVREILGNKEIPLGISVKNIFKALKEKKIVGVVGDQRGPRNDGIKVKFFGKDTYTFSGTASIAIKLKVPVLVLFSIRKPDGRYDCIIHEIDIKNLEGDTRQKIVDFNQKYMKLLEDTIRQNPEQWFWMHNIWKY